MIRHDKLITVCQNLSEFGENKCKFKFITFPKKIRKKMSQDWSYPAIVNNVRFQVAIEYKKSIQIQKLIFKPLSSQQNSNLLQQNWITESEKVKTNNDLYQLVNVEKSPLFKIGDIAEYDSCNFVYTGKINKITNKTITINKHKSSNDSKIENKRLDLWTFCFKNCDFNLDRIKSYNIRARAYAHKK